MWYLQTLILFDLKRITQLLGSSTRRATYTNLLLETEDIKLRGRIKSPIIDYQRFFCWFIRPNWIYIECIHSYTHILQLCCCVTYYVTSCWLCWQQCGKPFAHSQSLKKHLLTHQPGALTVKCQFCVKTFKSVGAVYRHCRTSHLVCIYHSP